MIRSNQGHYYFLLRLTMGYYDRYVLVPYATVYYGKTTPRLTTGNETIPFNDKKHVLEVKSVTPEPGRGRGQLRVDSGVILKRPAQPV